jgi:hypothetical protein
MSQEYLHVFQESGMWISGLFLATFSLVGVILMLSLVKRWGEIFPRWMVGLAGHRVPIVLAVVPASLVSVLLIVGGITIWSALDQMVAASVAVEEIIFQTDFGFLGKLCNLLRLYLTFDRCSGKTW